MQKEGISGIIRQFVPGRLDLLPGIACNINGFSVSHHPSHTLCRPGYHHEQPAGAHFVCVIAFLHIDEKVLEAEHNPES